MNQSQAPARPTQSSAAVKPSARDPVADWLDVFMPMLRLPKARAAEIRAELEDHLRARVDDLMIAGQFEPEATRKAVAELGETAELAKQFRTAHTPSTRTRIMHTALIAAAGAALVFGGVSINNTANTTAGSTTAPAAAAIAAIAVSPSESLRRYDVSTLINAAGPLEGTSEGVTLVETICSLVSTDEWAEFGGTETILLTGNTLFIDASDTTHEGVLWVLDTLNTDAQKAIEMQLMQAERQRVRRAEGIERVRVEYRQLREQLVSINHELGMLSLEVNRFWSEEGNNSDEMKQRKIQAESIMSQTQIDREDILARLARLRDAMIDLEMQDLFQGLEPLNAQNQRGNARGRGGARG